jgi:hypothetical protein
VDRRTLMLHTPLAALLAACGSAQSRTAGDAEVAGGAAGPAPPQGSAGAAVRGGTLTVAMPRDAANFDPVRQSDAYASAASSNAVDALFEIDGSGKPVGRLVEKTETPHPNV